MWVEELVADLERRDIRLWHEGDKLIVAPANRLTEADRAVVQKNRMAIIAYLRAETMRRAADATDATLALLDRLKCYALPAGRMLVANELAAILRNIKEADLQTIRSVLEAFECELIFRGGLFDPAFQP